MRMLTFGIAILVMVNVATAQDKGPTIIPEALQEIALKYPIADRLGIKWDGASTDDVGRYMGFLAAANEVASLIAVYSISKGNIISDHLCSGRVAAASWPAVPRQPVAGYQGDRLT